MSLAKESPNDMSLSRLELAECEVVSHRHDSARHRGAECKGDIQRAHEKSYPRTCRSPTDYRDTGGFSCHMPKITRHGQARLQQRGITLDQVVMILDFGRVQRAHGASRYFLDKQTRRRLALAEPQALYSLGTLDIHVVLGDDGTLITAAHRTKRIRRDIQKSRRNTNRH